MGLLKGITVTLCRRTSAGKDEFNRDIWEEERIQVENVLVAPISQTDTEILSELSLSGKKARYQLGIPKGDTHVWEDSVIEFFGARWQATGFATMGIDELSPLGWNRKVVVERYG